MALFASGLYALPLAALAGSYRLIAPGTLLPVADSAPGAVAAVGEAFALALRLAAPFIVAGLLWQCALGLLARLVPNLQVFAASLPGQILLGLVLLALLAAGMVAAWQDQLRTAFGAAAGAVGHGRARPRRRRPDGSRHTAAAAEGARGRPCAALARAAVVRRARRHRAGAGAGGAGGGAPARRNGWPGCWRTRTNSARRRRCGPRWRRCLAAAAPFVLAALVAGTAAVLVQTGFLIHPQALQPDLARLSPRAGLKRVFGGGDAGSPPARRC